MRGEARMSDKSENSKQNDLKTENSKSTEMNADNVQPKSKKLGAVTAAVCITVLICAAVGAFAVSLYTKNMPADDRYEMTFELRTSTTSSQVPTSVSTTTKKRTTTSRSVTSSTRKTSAKATTAESTTTSVDYSFPADVNKVSFEQLCLINGVGEVTASNIINFRQSVGVITNMDMLLQINGIGEKTLQKLKEYLYVSDADYIEITTTAATTTTQRTETTTQTTQTQISTEKQTSYLETKKPETSKTAMSKTSPTETSQQLPEMKTVNINTATAQELSECLLIDIELADKIVELRDNIQYFSNDLELLYVDGFSQNMLVERRPYIEL